MTFFLKVILYNINGEDMKKILILLCCSILLGVIFALYVYKEYNSKVEMPIKTTELTTVYLLQIGAYKNEENVIKISKNLPNYLVEKIDNIYHVYVGIVKNKENIEKIKEFYKVFGNNIYVRDIHVTDLELIEMITEYEKILIQTTKKEVVYTINKELLNKYKEVMSGRSNA